MSDREKRGSLSGDDRMKGKNFVTESAPDTKMVSSFKRKIRSEFKRATKARKKARTHSGSSATISTLPWKTLSHAGNFGNADDDGILELEEVDNVQVVYEETPEGRIATFKVRCPRCDPGACLQCTSRY